MRYLRVLFICHCFLLCGSPSSAFSALPPATLEFEHFALEDGLSNPIVYDIVQDGHGFLWFATGNGINRYNGYEFTKFLPNERDPNAIGRGPVTSMLVDSKNRVWAVVFSSGLYRYDNQKGRFFLMGTAAGKAPEPSHRKFYGLAEDKDGTIWLTTVDAGLVSYDESTDTFRNFNKSPDKDIRLPISMMSAILVDRQNTIWLSTKRHGLLRLAGDRNQFSQHLPNFPHAIGMWEDRFGDIWVPSLGKGVARYIRNEDRFKIYTHNPNDPESLSNDQVIRVVEDGKGTVWLTTWGGGVNIYDRDNDRFKRHQHAPARPKSLNNNNTWGILADSTDVMWIGTYGAGINKYDRKSERFQWVRPDTHGLPGSSIKAIHEDSKQFIWFGTLGAGLTRYDPKTDAHTHFHHDPKNPDSISNNNVWMIAEDSAGDLWLATDNGLNQYQRTTGRFIRHRHQPDDPNKPNSDIVRAVLVDTDDNVWTGSQNDDHYRFDRKSRRYVHYKAEGEHHTILYQDGQGRIWSGNAQAINRYDKTTDRFQEIKILPGNPDMLTKGFFTSIKEDPQGRLWVGMVGGLSVIDEDGTCIKQYGVAHGLNDDSIADFQFDNRGRIWVSTARGLSVMNLATERFRNYELGSYNRGASIITADGRLYFGGLHGATHFRSTDITDNPHIPPIAITKFSTPSKSHRLSQMLAGTGIIQLTDQDRLFSLEFAALDYANPSKNRYRYKLDGFDTEWIPVDSKRRHATYTNLDPGDYTFRVVGSNNDAVWNTEGISIPIRISPPWWETGWFYVLAGATLAGLIGFGFHVKTAQLKKEKRVSRHIRESEEKLRLIFENSPLGIVHFDNRGTITTCNDALCDLLNHPKDTLIGKSVSSHFHCHQMQTAAASALTGQTCRYENDTDAAVGNATPPVRAQFGPIHTASGTVAGGIGIVEDISAQLVAERETAALEAKLQHAMKLEAIGTLAGGIAHDFNNILGVIIGYTELAQFKAGDNPMHDKELKQIQKAGMRAKDLVQQILAFSRQDDMEMIPIQPALIIKDGLKMLRPALPATVSIQTDIDAGTPLILANPTQMHQVLINLCTNSAHAMEETGGTLSIALKEVELTISDLRDEPDIRPGRFARLSVCDTGPGIPEVLHTKIFEPYFTTKAAGKGTGMGLSIVHGIVKSYGGFISIQCPPDQGTQSHIFFPASTDIISEVTDDTTTAPGGNQRILMVDDEELLVVVGKELLEQLGYTVTTFTDSRDALEAFRKEPGLYDLVITDQTMPNMTGVDLAKHILGINPSIPIIICTGYSSVIDETKTKSLGIKALARKPLNRKDIALLIQNVLKDDS